ncbi:unnamed protein product [Parnassius mnemosyne]|uniref:Vacuolar protein sorting-associated protein 33B n=1 Tax=Parnassius mnemosyne TaxID=213953 RepID=A0AAV1KG62_9NEOP
MEPLQAKLVSMCLISQHKLEKILSLCGDKSDLIIDSALIKPLERICGVTWLRQHGVEKIYKMDPQLGPTVNIIKVYFIPACIQKYKCVLDHISSQLSQKPSLADLNCFNIIIVPKVLHTYDSILESRGMHGVVKLHSFSWELMSLDDRLLSLELPFLFKQLYVEQNLSLLSSISMSLWSLFHVTGRPKCVMSLGKLSSSVLDILEIYNETYSRDFVKNYSSDEIDTLVLIDRNQDYASSLLTPATYSGLLSEIFNISCGHLDLNVKETKYKKGKLNFTADAEDTSKKVTMTLDSSIDNLYGEIKHRHFSEVLSVLSSKAKLLKNEDIKALGIQEIKHFVTTKLQQVTLFKQNLVNHVLACETIISEMNNKFENITFTESEMLNNRNKKSNYSFVDENFGTDIHMYNSLRLMCLLSLTQGLSYDEYNTLVNKYLLAFGYKFLYIFNNLINAGLLVQPSSPKLSLNISNLSGLSDRLPRWQNSFQSLASKLKQLPSQADNSKTSPSYVFNGGYIPLIAIVCNALLTSESLSEALTKLSVLNDLKLGGSILDNTKEGMETLNEKLSNLKLQNSELDFGCRDAKTLQKLLKTDPKLTSAFSLKTKSVLVYVIGGVTYAEVAACNVIQTATGSKIYVASDCIASGCDFMAANT